MPDNDSLKCLQGLLRELFQLDLADLDFGLYRIFKIKRQEVEEFLTQQIPDEVNKAFAEAAHTDKEKLAQQIEELAGKVRQTVADDAILPSGEPQAAYANIKIVGEYREVRERLARVEASEAHRNDVFNHLYAFFSRYYDDGDFIPRRFFGSGPAAARPPQGPAVH
jgi:adenine-specific DNA-methyltransferase